MLQPICWQSVASPSVTLTHLVSLLIMCLDELMGLTICFPEPRDVNLFLEILFYFLNLALHFSDIFV